MLAKKPWARILFAVTFLPCKVDLWSSLEPHLPSMTPPWQDRHKCHHRDMTPHECDASMWQHHTQSLPREAGVSPSMGIGRLQHCGAQAYLVEVEGLLARLNCDRDRPPCPASANRGTFSTDELHLRTDATSPTAVCPQARAQATADGGQLLLTRGNKTHTAGQRRRPSGRPLSR